MGLFTSSGFNVWHAFICLHSSKGLPLSWSPFPRPFTSAHFGVSKNTSPALPGLLLRHRPVLEPLSPDDF